MTKFMVAVDGSSNAKAAFYTALSMAKNAGPDSRLFVATVIPDYKSYMNWTFGEDIDTVAPFLTAQETAKQAGERFLREYYRLCEQEKVQCSLVLGVSNHVGEMLCKAVTDKDIDFLILGRRGLGAIKRLVTGSTSKYVVEHASCNVLIVKGEWGPDEEHVDKKTIQQMEETARKEKGATPQNIADKQAVGKETAAFAGFKSAIESLIPIFYLYQFDTQ